jgi:hypothetical protein
MNKVTIFAIVAGLAIAIYLCVCVPWVLWTLFERGSDQYHFQSEEEIDPYHDDDSRFFCTICEAAKRDEERDIRSAILDGLMHENDETSAASSIYSSVLLEEGVTEPFPHYQATVESVKDGEQLLRKTSDIE